LADKKIAALAYPAQFEPQPEGGFTISFPDFCTQARPGGGGYGKAADYEEALRQAADLLDTIVASHLAEGWDLPSPSPARGRPLIALDPLVAAKAELYRAMRAGGVTQAELAGRLGVELRQVLRLLDPKYKSRIGGLCGGRAAARDYQRGGGIEDRCSRRPAVAIARPGW
jgi:predicted RNase H-like HicB family nuclease